MNFSEYWLISAPREKSILNRDPLNHLNQITIQQDLSINWKFRMPELKIGTFDSLLALSDGLDKVDSYVEQVTRKVANQLVDVLEEHYSQGYGNMDCRVFKGGIQN
jgi:V-type H+-transporting ATPase subunit C